MKFSLVRLNLKKNFLFTQTNPPNINHSNQRLFYPSQRQKSYVPWDLNDKNVGKWLLKKLKSQKTDAIDLLNVNPLNGYKDIGLLSHFVTEMGTIKGRDDTGLTLQNQRKVAKAIKRARCAGILPYTYKLDSVAKDENSILENRLLKRLQMNKN